MKAKEKGKVVAIAEHDLGSDSGGETKITAMGLKGKHVARTSTSNCSNDTHDEDTRIKIFHIRVVSKHTNIDTIFDSGSQANLISKYLVKQLRLENIRHPRPYPLGWI